MKRFISSLLLSVILFTSFAQTANDRVAELLNNSRWFELKEYMQTPNDSVAPFLVDFSNAMIAQFFNQPEKAVSLIGGLLNSGQLDVANLSSLSQLMAHDLSKLNKNSEAAVLLTQMLEAIRQYIDEPTILTFTNQINKYKAYSEFSPYQFSIPNGKVNIPMRIDTIEVYEGKPELIIPYLTNSKLNGNEHDFRFDTGAGMNVISPKLAREIGIKILDATETAQGADEVRNLPLAMADSIEFGELKIYDVPFIVMDVVAGNDSLDQYLTPYTDLIVGSELMNAVKNIKVDFEHSMLSISDSSFVPDTESSNMIIPYGNQLIVQCKIDGKTILVHPDCGDSSAGCFFGPSWPMLKGYVSDDATLRNGLMGGAGGYHNFSAYTIHEVPLMIGNQTITIPTIDLSEYYNPEPTCSARIGIKTFMLCKNVVFNLNKMIMAVNQ